MKTHANFMALFAVTFLSVLTGCQKDEQLPSLSNQLSSKASVAVKNASADLKVSNQSDRGKPVPVTITMTFTGGSFPTITGPVTTTDNLIIPGQGSMFVNVFGNVFHCVVTIVTSQGTIKIKEECNQSTFMGVWQIVEGTGAYVNLRGNGKVFMPSGAEILEGKIHWIK